MPNYDPNNGKVSEFTILGLSEGTHTLIFSASDNAGNVRDSDSISVTVDDNAPTFSLSQIGTVSYSNNSWTIPILLSNATDVAGGSGLSSSEWKYWIDNETNQYSFDPLPPEAIPASYSAEITRTTLSGGTHVLHVRCADKAGNTTEHTIDIVVDNIPPVIDIGTILNTVETASVWTNAPTLTVTAADQEANTSGLKSFTLTSAKKKLSADVWDTADSVTFDGIRLSFTEEGIFKLVFTATDRANNTATVTAYARIDRTPPMVSNSDGTSNTTSIPLSATDAVSGVDASTFGWRVDGADWNAGAAAAVGEGKNRQLEIRVKDLAGNEGIKTITLTVDTSAPLLSASVGAYARVGALAVADIVASDAVTTVTTVLYLIDGGAAQSLTGWASGTASIPVSGAAEGRHLLTLRALDQAGNTGDASYQFIVDNSVPVVSGITVSVAGVSYDAGTFLSAESVSVGVEASDTYVDGAGSGTGTISACYWDIKQDPNAAPVFSNDRKSQSTTFDTGGFSNGANYLYVRVEDSGGNLSQSVVRKVLIDRGIPSAPVVSSSTHAYASVAEDASMAKTAVFAFTPAGSSSSGLSAYRWRLVKTIFVNGTEGGSEIVSDSEANSVAARVGASLSLDLGDNGENEYYRLFVKGIGGNGVAGTEAEYRFRIDSVPPKNLRVWTAPQTNAAAWYSARETAVSWNKPADMTGVKTYRYFVTTALDWVAPTDATAATYDVSGWSSTTANEARVDLRALFGASVSGTARIGVCAEDFAGNRMFATASIKNDFAPPTFEPITGTTMIQVSDVDGTGGLSKKITWGASRDDESGLASLSVILSGPGIDRSISLQSGVSETVVDGLTSDSVYSVAVRAYDAAGNAAEIRNAFTTGSASLPAEYRVPYADDVDGYVIEGTRVVAASDERFENVSVRLPDGIVVSRIEENLGVITKTPIAKVLLETVETENGAVARGSSASGRFEITLDGFTLEGTAIGFDRSTGLSLIGGVYTRKVTRLGSSEDQAIALGATGIGFPANPGFESGWGTVNGNVAIATETADDLGTLVPGFPVGNVSQVRMSGGNELVGGTPAIFDSSQIAASSVSLARSDGTTTLSLSDVRLSSASREVRAVIDESALNLVLQNTTYTVLRSSLRGRVIDVYEASLALPEGYLPRTMTLRNFSVNGATGLVAQGRDFTAGEVTITTSNGTLMTGTNVRLDSSGRLLVDGVADNGAYGTLPITGLVLTNQGGDWETGAALRDFTTVVHGFPVSASSARMTGRGIMIDTGAIRMYGSDRRLESLGLETTANNLVYDSGVILDEFQIDSGYGAPVTMTGGSVEVSGVFGAFRVPIPQTLVGGQTDVVWTIPRVAVNATGTLAGTDGTPRSLTIGGYAATVSGVTFTGTSVGGAKTAVTTPDGFTPTTLELEGLVFDWSGIKTAPKKTAAATYSFAGWTMGYAETILDANGLGGVGSLALPEKLGGYAVQFPNSRIAPSGVITSGEADGENDAVLINGIKTRLPKAVLVLSLSTYTLESATAVVPLEWIDGPDLVFGRTVIDNTGTVVSSVGGTTPVYFVSANKYRVRSSAYRIGAESILLDGTMSPDWWNGIPEVAVADIKLLSDYSAVGDNVTVTVSYPFADWNVSGTGIHFGYSAFTSDANRVVFRGTGIDLGPLSYTTEGYLVDESVKQVSLNISLFGGRFTLSETRFDSDGLSVSAFVTLPEQLGGYEMLFDPIILHPDGSFDVEDRIDQIGFDAGGFTFKFENVRFNSSGLRIGKADITLPEALEQKHVVLDGLSIENDGTVTLDGANVDPFTMWGLGFNLTNLSIIDQVVSFEGSVTLPETMPGVLSGRSVGIRSFKVNLSGEVLAFDIRLEGEYTVPFMDSWSLTIESLGTAYENGHPYIRIAQAKLTFPEGYMVESATIQNIQFDPIAGTFDFSKITASTDIEMMLSGIRFVLTNLTITNDLTVGFGGTAQFPTSGVPTFLAGKLATITNFEIKRDGSLGNVLVSLSGLSGEITPEFRAVRLSEGRLELTKEGSKSLLISVTGSLVMTAYAPEGLVGKALRVEKFTVDAAIPTITELKAGLAVQDGEGWSSDPAKINFDPIVFGTQFNNVYAGVNWNAQAQSGTFELSGGVIFPASFPAFLAGKEARVTVCRVGFDGTVQAFGAGFSTEPGVPYDAFGLLQMRDVAIAATLSSGNMRYDLAGTFTLPIGTFPEGIGGTQASAAMVFDNATGLVSANAECALPDQLLFGALGMRGMTVYLDKRPGNPLMVKVRGGLVLPDSFPEGLRGVPITIRAFSINTDGVVNEVDIGASNIAANIFGTVALSGGSVSCSKGGGNDEFLVNLAGTVKLIPSALPQAIKDASFRINKLELSTKTGLRSFDVGLIAPVGFEILGGLKIGVNSLSLNQSEFVIAASATLPSSYPGGLANTRFDLTRFAMGWDGSIRDIQGGLGSMNITLAGFTGSISKLYFLKDNGQFWITLETCRITMPANFGTLANQSFAIKNAKFSPDTGAFIGDIETPRMEPEFAGFRLTLESPSIEFSQRRIKFSRATINTPDFMGNVSISLNNVVISADSGFQVGGGGFRLPDFAVSGIGFKNVAVDFVIDGSTYAISGQGAAMIPGAGTLGAKLSFATRCADYPIGLKQAYFSYEMSGLGLPLGATGLYLNGIRGGLAYGPPDEIPAKVRGMFTNGTRLQLGIHVVDQTVGTVLDMNADVWVDITNIAWAFQGNATVMRGTLNMSANLIAAATGLGFYAGLDVQLTFAKGSLEFYIFNKDGSVLFAGKGRVQFGMQRGKIFHWGAEWWHPEVNVPGDDMWLPEIGADAGRFSNGRTGFKGYVDLPMLGQCGVFVGPGAFDIGNVSGYSLVLPDWARSVRSTRFNAVNPSIVSNDQADRGDTSGATYQFVVPAKSKKKVSSSVSASIRSSVVRADTQVPSIEDSGLERMVFFFAFFEGDPVVTAIAPSGREYHPNDPGVETSYFENGMAFIVYSPEAGNWKLQISNIEQGMYQAQVVGKEGIPKIDLLEPSYRQKNASVSLDVSGASDTPDATVGVYATSSKDVPGKKLGTLTVATDGRYAGTVDTASVPDGDYLIYARLEVDGDSASATVFAPGSALIDRKSYTLVAPSALIASETDAGTLSLRWEDTNGARTAGYNLYLRDVGANTETVQYLGAVKNITIPGYESGKVLEATVSALDESKRESAKASIVTVTMGGVKPEVNAPRLAVSRVETNVTAGGFAGGTLNITFDGYSAASGAAGYVTGRSIAPIVETEFVKEPVIAFSGPVKAASGGSTMDWKVNVPEAMTAGTREYLCEIVNEANNSLSARFTLVLNVSYPAPTVTAVQPAQIDGRAANTVTILGTGFVPGTKAYFEGREMIAVTNGLGQLTVTLDPATVRGKQQITVTGPGGATAPAEIDVKLPDWTATLLSRSVETVAGGNASYPVSVTGVDGFTGEAEFTATSVPPGFNVSLPRIGAGTTGTIRILVASDAVPGEYKTAVTGGTGKSFELITIVTATPPVPKITSVNPSAGYIGDTVKIYGYGFGSTGTVTLGGKNVTVATWTDEVIEVVIEEGEASGIFVVTNERGASNEVAFTVRNRGFTLRPAYDRIELSAGEESTVNIALVGYADAVDLRVETDPGSPVSATLDKSSVKPNATLVLNVKVNQNAGNGNWTVAIFGSSGGYSNSTSLRIVVGDAFAIATESLPAGLVGVSYRAALASKNAVGETSFTLESGDLPVGLTMSRQGEIRGRPTTACERTVTIGAVDAKGRKDSKRLVITIREDAWGQDAKDGGNTRSVATDLPSNDVSAWSSSANGTAKGLLAAAAQVVIIRDSGLVARNAASGTLSWIADGSFAKVAYAGGKIYALRTDGTLEAHEADIGTVAWTRTGVNSFTTDGWTILSSEADGFAAVDAVKGQLLSRPATGYAHADRVVWVRGAAYERKDYGISGVYGSAASWASDQKVFTLSGDADGFLAATADALVLFDTALTETKRIPYAASESTEFALGEGTVLVKTAGTVTQFARPILAYQWSRNIDGSIALGIEKVIVAGSGGLSVLNGYTGADIWKSEGAKTAVALYGEKIYAAGADGTVVCYNGSPNATAPTTRLDLTPASADGSNDWYVTKPTLRVESADKETYVAEKKVKIGAAEWKTPESTEILAEGEYGLAAYGVDSRSLRGEEARSYVKIDATAPISELTLSAVEPATGWFLSPVTVTLSGTDAVSGLAGIRTSLETSAYTGPIAINTEGVHDVRWHAIDKAGNAEAERTVTIRIDLYPPYAEASVARDRGIAVVSLSAGDSGTGVDYIEYRTEGTSVARYETPIVFLTEGLHQVTYRAVDKAGRFGEWKTAEAFVSKNHGETRVIALAEASGEKRKAESPAHEGMPLFERDRHGRGDDDRRDERGRHDATVRDLPRYAKGGDYVQWLDDDIESAADPVGTFRVKKAAVVYVFTQSDAAAPAGWTLVEKKFRLNERYYPAGADVYMRRYAPGAEVKVPGKSAGTVAPLVIAQETKELEARIRIIEAREDRHGSDWDDRDDDRDDGSDGDERGHGQGDHGQTRFAPGEKVEVLTIVAPESYANNLPLSEKRSADAGSGWTEITGREYELPWTDGTYTARFKVEVSAPDGVLECAAETTVTVRNLAEFKLNTPKPGTGLRSGDRVRLDYSAKDASGDTIPERKVAVYERVNGGVKKALKADRGDTIKAPNEEGRWELIFEMPIAPGRQKTESYTFNVQKRR